MFLAKRGTVRCAILKGRCSGMKERVISIVIFVFSIVYLAGSISIDVGTIAQPGPGFLPAGIAIALLFASGVNVYKAFRTVYEKKGEGIKITPIAMAVLLFFYPILLKPTGYIISTCIVFFILLRLMKFKNLPASLITAIFTTVISFYIFSTVLGVVLPSGPIEDMITKLL
jgi:putative tricarboxylic transport membrane protein